MCPLDRRKFMDRKSSFVIWSVYGLVLFFFVFKMFFYAEEVRDTPDEKAHVGYICYLEENPDKIIPDFEDMYAYRLIDENNGEQIYRKQPDDWNYLGHPPLYYHMMRLAFQARREGNDLVVNVRSLRYFNILLTAATMAVCFFIGYTRISRNTKKIMPHVIFSVSAVSVPMIAYVGSGVSNDNLAFLGMVLFFWGLLRYYEERTDHRTYLLVGTGFFVTMFSKLTAGEILVVALLFVLLGELIRKRGLRIIWNRYFVATLLLYLIPVVYYLILYSRYGSFQPSLQLLHYDAYMRTTSYVSVEQRPLPYTFAQYTFYYWPQFFHSWVTLYGHIFTLNKFHAYLSWLGPCLVLVLSVCQGIRMLLQRSKMAPMYAALLGGTAVTMLTQFWSAYKNYCSAGYTGGYQARYYLCMIVFFAYSGAMLWCREGEEAPAPGRKEILFQILGVLYLAALLYGDFIYVLFHGAFRMG